MDTLIQDLLEFLREEAKRTTSLLATAEEMAYFAPILPLQKPPILKQKESHNLPERAVIKAPSNRTAFSSLKRTPVSVPAPEPALAVTQPVSKPWLNKRDLAEMRQWVQKIFPEWALREVIPDDALAQRASRLWEERYLTAQVVVIAFGEVGAGVEFLKQVTSAIDRLLMPAQLIEGSIFEKEQGWDFLLSSSSLQWVICSPWPSWKTTTLAQYYRQNGATGEQFLGSHRLLLLEPSPLYFKHPDRKRELWNILNTRLSS